MCGLGRCMHITGCHQDHEKMHVFKSHTQGFCNTEMFSVLIIDTPANDQAICEHQKTLRLGCASHCVNNICQSLSAAFWPNDVVELVFLFPTGREIPDIFFS